MRIPKFKRWKSKSLYELREGLDKELFRRTAHEHHRLTFEAGMPAQVTVKRFVGGVSTYNPAYTFAARPVAFDIGGDHAVLVLASHGPVTRRTSE